MINKNCIYNVMDLVNHYRAGGGLATEPGSRTGDGSGCGRVSIVTYGVRRLGPVWRSGREPGGLRTRRMRPPAPPGRRPRRAALRAGRRPSATRARRGTPLVASYSRTAMSSVRFNIDSTHVIVD